ncbi:MAG: response regulator transcription factor [bacterium]|nr:response regulator transcription factor [bacterium]
MLASLRQRQVVSLFVPPVWLPGFLQEENMGYQVLLITGNRSTAWGDILRQALANDGDLFTTTVATFDSVLTHQLFDLIIVDASEVADFTNVVREIRHHLPQSQVLVVTASPTWQRARDAMQAGAVDYVRKTQNPLELTRYLQSLLSGERPQPPEDTP